MKKICFLSFIAVFIMAFTSVADAVCPVCTVAIGAGLETARLLGVKDVITGIWAGGLTMSLIGWTANYMRGRNIHNVVWYIFSFIIYYALLAGVYFIPNQNPIVNFGEYCMWGIDQFLLGTIVGSVCFFAMQKWYEHIKANNGGHALFPFQKVVMPFGGLVVMTLIFWAIIKWLPQIGIVLC